MPIVFGSSDRDAESFASYFAEMPWLALPFEERDLKNKLSKKFKVDGIPSLVLLDQDGTTITKDGRSAVMQDEFPWTPKTFADVIGTEFMRNDGETVEYDELEGKTLGIYFSAHWCPPCRQFTPRLGSMWSHHLKAKGMQMVFVSADHDVDSFKVITRVFRHVSHL